MNMNARRSLEPPAARPRHAPLHAASGAPYFPKGMPRSTIHFWVHRGLPEIGALVRGRHWQALGWDAVRFPWMELRYTTDGWETVRTLRTDDARNSFAPDGRITLPGVPPRTPVEFALHVCVAAGRPEDGGEPCGSAEVWLNNGGRNYRQETAPVTA